MYIPFFCSKIKVNFVFPKSVLKNGRDPIFRIYGTHLGCPGASQKAQEIAVSNLLDISL